MQGKRGQSFIQGAFILAAATIVVKIIGMFYKIPLGNILGAGGMSYFMSAYSIFNPVYALSVSGFPVAVSKLVSEYHAKKQWRDMARVRRVSFFLFLVVGVVGMLFMMLGAKQLAQFIGNPHAALAIAAIAPAILFCCIISSFRGYYQGLHNMMPTAVSQVVEAVFKLICGILLAVLFMEKGMTEYAAQGTVFGAFAENLDQAQLLVLPYGAAGAVLGVAASSAAGAIYLLFYHLLHRTRSMMPQALKASPKPQGSWRIAKSLVMIALPVCLSAAVSHISNLVDVITVMNRIETALMQNTGMVLAQYAGLLPNELALQEVPSYLYGAFSYTTSLFNLVPALTVTLGISALPVISASWSVGNRQQASERIQSVLKLSALLAIPAGLGMAALSEPILQLLYPARVEEVAIAAPLLTLMGVAAVFVGITTPLMSVFQAIGKTMLPVKLMLLGAGIKAVVNYALLAVPQFNIKAAPIGTICCYIFILLAGIACLQKELGCELPLHNILLKPFICGILCAVAANTSYNLMGQVLHSRLTVLLAVAVGGAIYGFFILFLRIITKKEAFLMPNGKKIVKILEKLGVLG